MHELEQRYTVVIVTHNMQQAARVSDKTAFFSLDPRDRPHRHAVEWEDDAQHLHQPGGQPHQGLRHRPFG